MTVAQDRRTIKKALKQVPVSEGQWAMAWILYHSGVGVSGTLEYIYGLEPRGLLLWQQTPHYKQLSFLPDETNQAKV